MCKCIYIYVCLKCRQSDHTQIPLQKYWIVVCGFCLALYRKKTQPPIADKKEINIVEINTTLSISPFSLRKAVELWPASQHVVQSKMSNQPLGLFLCVICATAPGWKYDAWAGQSRVRGEGLGEGLGIVSRQHCCRTLWQLDILPKGDIVFSPRSDIKGTYSHDEGAIQPTRLYL